MSSGERMVFAAAFVESRSRMGDGRLAAVAATAAVRDLREAGPGLDDDERAMVSDMLGEQG